MIYSDDNNFTGAVLHYTFVNIAVWWFFHLSLFLYQMMFPFHAQRAKYTGKLNYAYAVLVLLGKYYVQYNYDVHAFVCVYKSGL